MANPPVVAHDTLVGLRAEMTISGEEVDVEGVLGKDFFFQLSQEAKLGTPISFAYWLNDTYNVDSDGIKLLTLRDDYPTLAAFQAAYNEDKAKAENDKDLPKKIKANLQKGGIPEPVHKIMITALLAELSITDLIIDIKKGGDGSERKKLKFGLAIAFPSPLDLIPNVSIRKVSLLILHAPADDFKFPDRQKQLGEPEPLKAKATGFITFSGKPDDQGTITLGGATWTFVTAEPKAGETHIGGDLDETLVALARDLNRSENPEKIRKCTYRADLQNGRLLMEFNEGGLEGNTFALNADAKSKGTTSSPTLQGGADPEAPLPRLIAPAATSTKASGSIKFKKPPKDADTITLNGTKFTFKDTPAQPTDVSVGNDIAKVLGDLIAAIGKVNELNDYDFAPEGSDILKITAKAAGSAGESFTLDATPATTFNRSGPTLKVGT